MTSITIADLNNAKTDVDHIAAIATSTAQTATDRLGHTKLTMAGAIAAISAFNNRGAWAPATPYILKDIVLESGVWYLCVVAHTSSGTFAADVASKWRIFQGITSGELSVAGGSNLIGYVADATGAVPRSVEDKLQENLSLLDFGAAADGSTDDSAPFAAAWVLGRAIDGGGKRYKLNTAIAGGISGTKISNCTLDFTGCATTGPLLSAFGTLGTPVALTANTGVAAYIVTVGSTASFAVDGLVFLKSSKVWDAATATTYGCYAQIKSIDSGTQLTLHTRVFLAFNTADSATIAPVSECSGFAMDRVHIIAGQANTQQAVRLEYCYGHRITNCIFEDVDYAAVATYRCFGGVIDGCQVSFSRAAGTSYGFTIWGGCYDTKVINSTGNDCRHTVTIGDNDGLNMFNYVAGCHALSAKDAGFDSHAASMFTTFIGNTVRGSAVRNLTSNHEGLINEGAHAVFIGNTVIDALGNGIHYGPTFRDGTHTTCIIDNNTVILADTGYAAVSSSGINVNIDASYGCLLVDSVSITNNKVGGGQNNTVGVQQFQIELSAANAVVKKVTFTGNTSIDPAITYAAFFRTSGASSSIQGLVFSNNQLDSAGTRCAYLLSDGAGSFMNNITGGSNIFTGGTSYTVHFSGVPGTLYHIRWGRNVYINSTIRIRREGFSDIALDDLADAAPLTTTVNLNLNNQDGNWFIWNGATNLTATLPDPTLWTGRELRMSQISTHTVVSASANVVPITGAAASTAILSATTGSYAVLKADGTNWRIVSQG
jgi:hypothetical protein